MPSIKIWNPYLSLIFKLFHLVCKPQPHKEVIYRYRKKLLTLVNENRESVQPNVVTRRFRTPV